LVAGLLLADGSHGEGVPFAVVHELAVVRFAFFLEGCHWRLLVAEQRQINATEACAEELQKVVILQNGARSRFRRNSLPCKVPETGIEPALPVMGTRPSTWRVCQFRHSGAMRTSIRYEASLPEIKSLPAHRDIFSSRVEGAARRTKKARPHAEGGQQRLHAGRLTAARLGGAAALHRLLQTVARHVQAPLDGADGRLK